MDDGIELARAYVQIVPTTKGIRQKLKSSMGGDVEAAGEDSGNRFGEKFKGAVAAAAKVAAAGIGAAVAGVAAIAKNSVEGYAEYEQLVGGVETLFGAGGQSIEEYAESVGKSVNEASYEYYALMKAQDVVLGNASKAFETAGLSANEYMATVTGISASLIQSLGGDTAQAAGLADQAIIDMADNANKMGSSMESIQNAYQGFAKQNYTMLDNLKLGYGGTSKEMYRLLSDAAKLDEEFAKTANFSIDEKGQLTAGYADIVEAIHIVQTEMGITGTTAKEAASTIQGSKASMKAAWQNLTVGLADENQNMDALIQNFVDTAVTYLQGNLVPRIQTVLGGIARLVEGVAPIVEQQLPVLIQTLLPPLITAAGSLLTGIITALPTLLETLIAVLPTLMQQITDALLRALPLILNVGLQLIVTLANGIAENLPTLLPTIVGVVTNIVSMLIDNVGVLIDAAIEVMLALANGLITAIPMLIEKAPEIISKLALAIVDNLPKILETGLTIVISLAKAIIEAIPQLVLAEIEMLTTFINGLTERIKKLPEKGREMVESIKNGLMEKINAAKTWGKDLIENFIGGLKEKWEKLKESVSNIAGSIKSFLGFSEPKEGPLSNFHTYAPDMMELFAKGIKDNEYLITGQIEDSFNLEPVLSDRYRTPGELAQNRTSSNVFNIYAAEGMDARDIAEKVSMILAEEERKAAAWA